MEKEDRRKRGAPMTHYRIKANREATAMTAPNGSYPEVADLGRANRAFHDALRKYPDAFEALHYFWNEGIAGVAQGAPERRIAQRLADVVMMLDAPDAYNRGYIAAVCRSILSSLSSTTRATLPGHDETMANLDALTIGGTNFCGHGVMAATCTICHMWSQVSSPQRGGK